MKRITKFCRWCFTIGLLFLFCGQAWSNQVTSIRTWPAPDKTRVVIDLREKPTYTYFTLTEPGRLVVDLRDTSMKTSLPIAVEKSEVLSRIRKSTPSQAGGYRMVLELNHMMTPNIFDLAPTPDGTYGYRLVIDLPHKSKPAEVVTATRPAAKPSSPTASTPLGSADIIVAIDAGHGGEDPGSVGPSRRYEKDVTLSVSRKLAQKINQIDGMRAVLTRDGDYFLSLNQRTEKARKNKAHLLVSVHADGFHKPQPRGASVWVLNTRRANTEIGRWLEQHEKQSELLGGGDVLAGNQDDHLTRTVLDLQFSNSQREGFDVATRVLSELRKVTTLHKSKPEYASLAVLKSPDIPSLLVETGFITNPSEEQLLFNRSHQDKLANAILAGIESYFDVSPPDGTLWAARRQGIRHAVVAGDSLGKLAQRYGTTVSAIKKRNDLSSTTLRIGQTLMIPDHRAPSPVVRQPIASGKTVTHVVKRGEFLGRIARHYDVTVQSIREANQLRSDKLVVGQKLKIEGVTQGAGSTTTAKTITHTVVSGDYLGKIAEQYGVSVQAIRDANNLKRDQLRVGQKLKIAQATRLDAPTTQLITYTVKRGDFLGKIAEQHGVSAQSIRVQNNLTSDKLLVGQKLRIAASITPDIAHTVRSGEFLGKIADQYGVSVDSLRRINQLRSDQLAIGQVLKIPSS